MAARMPVEILWVESCCSICLGIFQDPVSIHCGHSFCRSCITETWEGLTTNFSCLQCRETGDQKSLRPNRELADMIEAAKRLNLQPDREVEGGENLCEDHQEPLKLFCQDDKRLICVVCDGPRCIVTILWFPWMRLPRSARLKDHSVGAHQFSWQDIVTTYRKLHEFLEKQESSLLAQLEQLDTEIRKAHEEILQRLLEETRRLGTLIGEMERTYQQPDWQLLKVRAQRETLSHSLQISLHLEKKFSDFTKRNPDIKELLEKFQGTKGRSRKGNAIVDGQRQALYLSEDCKLVRWEPCAQDLPSNPRRFSVCFCVLGSRGFTSGWHRWDMEVHGEGYCVIGVAKESVPRDREFVRIRNEGVWALCHIQNEYQALTSPDATLLTLRRVPKRIRICLDYEEGRVVFFDAKSKERIFAFPPASFQGERVFPWFLVTGDGSASLS
uniref:Uncharacterized protein n=1 Tax=Calidris pygmaea TaxID=425635 RepID=A0A8C3JHE1_9CHAR